MSRTKVSFAKGKTSNFKAKFGGRRFKYPELKRPDGKSDTQHRHWIVTGAHLSWQLLVFDCHEINFKTSQIFAKMTKMFTWRCF